MGPPTVRGRWAIMLYILELFHAHSGASTVNLNHSKTTVTFAQQWNLPMPERASQNNGELVIRSVRFSDAGSYHCSSLRTGKEQSKAVLVVQRTDNLTTLGYSTPAPVTSTFRPCVGNYCTVGNKTTNNLFVCANGERISEDLICNWVEDCSDGSDEAKCEFWPPKITSLPKHKVELYCGDEENRKPGVLVLECSFAGFPEPLVKWKKYEGHVPSKCRQSSVNGHGTLTCPFQESDQGAYSCVAENSKGSAESQPKSIAKCSNKINCSGFRVKTEDDIEHCLDCFCSGKTSECKSIASDLTVVEVPFPTTLVEVFVFNDGEVVFIPSDSELVPGSQIRSSSTEIGYCQLSKKELKETSFLKSYGRNMKIPRHTGKFDFLPDAPDIIIRGNGIDLMYNFNMISHSAEVFDVRFWPGNWHFLNKETAKRKDLMKVLANLDAVLFRCEYRQNVVLNFTENVRIESSAITNFTRSESYVEKCACPKGYEGLSCETCASGYKMKTVGKDFHCEKIDCPEGWSGDKCAECDASKNYFPSGGTCVKTICNPEGSVSLNPDSKGKCTCHKNVVGDSCDQCKAGFFDVRDGCLECWCSGVTDVCQSSDWYNTVISSTSLGGYNSSEGRNFWLLPSIFAGNLITSYGGHLNYTITYAFYIPKQLKPLTIELLTADDVTLCYKHGDIDESRFSTEKSWSAKLVESQWRKSNESAVTRGEFLSFLSNVKAVYIESPYHLSSGKANLTSARMSAAKSTGDGDEERALSIEQCKCPPGYTGLSCEKCADSYYRSKNGSRSVCLKCDCDNCDPLLGCLDCPTGQYQVNSKTEQKPVCKPCPCNNNEINCYKDSYDQIICRCHPGFMGIYCEKEIHSSTENFVIVSMSPRKVDSRKVGATVQFNCSYASDEDMKVVVKKFYSKREEAEVNGIEEQSTGNAHGKANLFDVVLEDDMDHVDCFVYTNKNTQVGHVRSEINPIKVTKPVKITNCYSDVISISENGTRDLICMATGTPTPMVTWFRSTPKVQKEKLSSIDGVHSIQNNETTLDNNGTVYYCLAENSEGSKDACTLVLVIRGKCETIHIVPEKVVVEEGETVSIQCRTSEYSPIIWARVGASPSPRQEVKNGKLKIVAAEVQDSGTYMCKAETKTGTINLTASVEVREKKIPPAVIIPENDKTLQVGENFSVTCEASGKPKPTVIWTKEKENFLPNVVARNETLKITGAEVGNTGVYKCTGRTGEEEAVAFILITVEDKRVKPQVAINGSGWIRAIEGQSVIVVCIPTKGFPAPSLEWSKKSSHDRTILRRNGTLAINNITRLQAGEYKCKGRNSAGESEAFATIQVLIPPKVNISVEEISVHEEENVFIYCMAIGYPKPSISWFGSPVSNGKPLTVTRTYGDFSTSFPVLVHPLESARDQIKFTASKDMDGARIKCVANNEAGTDEISARLKILQPEDEGETDSVEFAAIGSNFELTCDPFVGNATWKKEEGHLEGDVCEGANGLIIPSVQIQHGGKYVCNVKTMHSSKTKRITLKVVGFAPRFSQISRSYMILPVTLKSPYTLEAQISFRPAGKNGLLLEKRKNDFDLYLHKSRLHLYLKPKKGDPVNVTSDVIFEQNKWYSVVVFITTSNLDVTLYDERTSIIEKITQTLKNFDLGLETEDEFSVGGAFPRNGMSPPSRRRLFSHISSFEGCISRLTIEPKEFDLVADGAYSHNVTLCSRCSKNEDPCRGRGKCLDAPTQYGFICVCPKGNGRNNSCPASCSNKGCETRLNLCHLVNPCKRKDLHTCSNRLSTLECKCGSGYSGATCETVVEYSFCVKGNGFVKLPSSFLDRRSLHTPEIIKIKFVLHKVDGVLLWQGDATNHLFIAVRNRFLEYVYLNQGFELKVRADVALPLEEKILVEVSRINNTTQLKLDFPSGSVLTKNSTTFSTNRVKGDIYLGNLPIINAYYNKMYAGLSGCINFVQFGDKPKINLLDNALEKSNTVNNKSWQTKQDSKSKDREDEYDEYDDDDDEDFDD